MKTLCLPFGAFIADTLCLQLSRSAFVAGVNCNFSFAHRTQTFLLSSILSGDASSRQAGWSIWKLPVIGGRTKRCHTFQLHPAWQHDIPGRLNFCGSLTEHSEDGMLWNLVHAWNASSQKRHVQGLDYELSPGPLRSKSTQYSWRADWFFDLCCGLDSMPSIFTTVWVTPSHAYVGQTRFSPPMAFVTSAAIQIKLTGSYTLVKHYDRDKLSTSCDKLKVRDPIWWQFQKQYIRSSKFKSYRHFCKLGTPCPNERPVIPRRVLD